MNRINKLFTRSAVALAVAAILPSCAMEEPFGDGVEGNLTLTAEIRGDVTKHTRAVEADELASLREKCIVYIENSKGVIRKYKGLDNIPEQIKLRTGSYVAEAWSGDSVSASFDSKFYRGWQKFEINEGLNSLTLKCNIANVLASVNPESLNVNLSDLRVTFSHSRGSLEFDENNIPDAKGYFMMPNADKDLMYKVEGRKSDGSAFVREGKIENVQRAHEYCMTVTEEERPISEGGALIRIKIADIPVIEETVEIFGAPAVRGVDYDIAEQVVSTERNFKDTRVYVRGYFGLSSVIMNFSDNFSGMTSGQNILEGETISALAAKGVNVELRKSVDASADGSDVPVDELYVTFTKSFLDALPASAREYAVTFEATDGHHKEGRGVLRIANDENAVEHPAPVTSDPAPDPVSNPMAVLAGRATLSGTVKSADVVDYGIKYRVQGTYDWTAVSAVSAQASRRATRASETQFSVTITGLAPATTYEYIVYADDFDSADVRTFTTESVYSIPNASMETWGTYTAKTMLGTKTVTFPGSDRSNFFWDSGNEGASTANMILTDKSTDMIHSGTYSARLESKKALGMLAAGNMFFGRYAGTDGTNGILSLGRPYNGSHPAKLVVWANYRPGSGVTIKSGNESYVGDLTSGGKDQAQIYVALTDDYIEIRTNPENRKLFDPDDVHVLAYGQVTWKDAFGPDGQLQKLEIPFVYNDRAKTKRPTHLVIVASASKYGDYFSGAAGSVMYLDDFELVYE